MIRLLTIAGVLATIGGEAAAEDTKQDAAKSPPATNSFRVGVDYVAAGKVEPLAGESLLTSNQTKWFIRQDTKKAIRPELDLSTQMGLYYLNKYTPTGDDAAGFRLQARLENNEKNGRWRPYGIAAIEGAYSAGSSLNYNYVEGSVEAGTGFQLFQYCRKGVVQPQKSKCEDGGVEALLTAGVALTGSDKAERDRATPKLAASLTLTNAAGLAYYAKVDAQWELYRKDNSQPAAPARLDDTVKAELGVNITSWAKKVTPFALEAKIGGRWVYTNSNDNTKDSNVWQFIPTLSLGRDF